MTASGYQSAPLSDEMELRIKERLVQLRGLPNDGQKSMSSINALEWVLNEAEVLKLELAPEVKQPRFAQVAEFCPRCGHVHIDDAECGFPQGGGRVCRCERQVTA